MRKFVAYYRVSTEKQGLSGLGLEAQETAVLNYAKNGLIIGSFSENESGKIDKRPQLKRALELSKKENATLLIAKLDRLSRNASFILSLKESGINFIACDMPEANNMTIGILALVAQNEREAISSRTKSALAELKKRGVKLGNIKALQKAEVKETAFKNSLITRQAMARNNENNIKAYTLAKALKMQNMLFSQIVHKLNNAGFKTSKGNEFQIIQVQRLFKLFEA